MDILFWKDISIAIAIGSKVIDILNKMEITQKLGVYGGTWHRWEWLPKLENGMLIAGLCSFIFFSIVERSNRKKIKTS